MYYTFSAVHSTPTGILRNELVSLHDAKHDGSDIYVPLDQRWKSGRSGFDLLKTICPFNRAGWSLSQQMHKIELQHSGSGSTWWLRRRYRRPTSTPASDVWSHTEIEFGANLSMSMFQSGYWYSISRCVVTKVRLVAPDTLNLSHC